jgi:hypothetical protein
MDYLGEKKGGKPNGHGVITYKNGEKYEGVWKNGFRDRGWFLKKKTYSNCDVLSF